MRSSRTAHSARVSSAISARMSDSVRAARECRLVEGRRGLIGVNLALAESASVRTAAPAPLLVPGHGFAYGALQVPSRTPSQLVTGLLAVEHQCTGSVRPAAVRPRDVIPAAVTPPLEDSRDE